MTPYLDLAIVAIDLTKNEKKVILSEDGRFPQCLLVSGIEAHQTALMEKIFEVNGDWPDYSLCNAFTEGMHEVHLVYAVMIPESIKLKSEDYNWRNISDVQMDDEIILPVKESLYNAAFRV